MDLDAGCVIFAIMAIVLIVGLVIMAAQSGTKARERREAEAAYQARLEALARERREAEADYRSSLTALKVSPNDADLKGMTLQKGRIYSNLTRDSQGVTVFDEVALMNDINAACAGAGVHQPARDAIRSVDDRLADLQRLKERELITIQEYEQRRSEIIKEL